jgi:hypothetical protein
MSTRRPRYSKEEFARRGTELYKKIRPLVEQGNHGRIVAIDIETGDYELADDPLDACRPLIERSPDCQLVCFRIGYPYVDRIGPRLITEKP